MTVVAVTGAAGELGRRVVARLAADPDVAGVECLDVADRPASAPARSRWHRADLAGTELAPLLRGVDTIVHLAFVTTDHVDDPAALRANLDGTRRLLAAAAAVKARQVVVVSSATVYGAWSTNPVPITEDAALRPNPDFAYAVHKAEVERVVAEWRAVNPGTHVAVLRPTTAVAEDSVTWLARLLSAAAGLRAGDADPPVQFVHLDDVAAAVDVARKARLDGSMNVAPDGWIPGETARALRGRRPRLRLPERVAARVAAWSWELRLGPIPPGLVPYTVHPWVVANDRLRGAGWVPCWTSEEAFVAGTEGSRWSMMSPKRRQELALGAAGFVALVSTVAVAYLVRRARRRARALLGEGRPVSL